jgi:hypothetical protein
VLYSLPSDTTGIELEPNLWPNTHFRRQPNAAAADLSLCAISSSSERKEDEMAPRYRPELLDESDDAERVVDLERERVVGCWSMASMREEDSLSSVLDFFATAPSGLILLQCITSQQLGGVRSDVVARLKKEGHDRIELRCCA